MTSTSSPVLVVAGVGPGLGMSVAHRFGREGYAVALVSRSSTRHAGYLSALADDGVDAAAFTADLADPAALRGVVDAVRARFGRVDVGYFGPAALDGPLPGAIVDVTTAEVRTALESVLPAVGFASLLLPELRERGSGGLLFAGGLSSVVPMPPLGALALSSAAIRNYAVTLHAALAAEGVYAGTLTIGGLIERGDLHTAVTASPEMLGGVEAKTLDPDALAESLWALFRDRDRAEEVATA